MIYPLFKVHIDVEKALSNIKNVLESGYVNEGIQVNELKKALESFFETDKVILTNSGTNAITLALKLADVGPGDEVISTAMTCVASNTPIHNLKGKIIWADINASTGNIDPEEIRKKITPKTKAVICVNWAGMPCELDRIYEVCKQNNVKLIQDAAHSLGGKYNGNDLSKYADFTCYSLQAIKHLTTGDGGVLICQNDNDFKKGNKLKWFGLDREQTKDEKGEWKGQRWEMDIEEAGYKFNMNNISAAIGLSQLPHIERILNTHRKNAKLYSEIFKDNQNIFPLKYPEFSKPSFWVYTILLKDGINRDKVLEKLNDIGIKAGLVHVPNHNYTCFKESYCHLPKTEYFANHQISLPCGWWLKEEDIRHIADNVLNLIGQEPASKNQSSLPYGFKEEDINNIVDKVLEAIKQKSLG